MIDIFIPSYHRPQNIKTVKYFLKIGWDAKKLHVVIDSEADDRSEYEEVCANKGVNLHVFDMDESRRRFDYVHRPSKSRRSAGQARNMFYDIAADLGIDFFMMQDDDTTNYEIKKFGKYQRIANADDVKNTFACVEEFMKKHKIGLFGISQTGDFIGGCNTKLLRKKVMNTTFVMTRFIYRGERGAPDDDTSQFLNVMNEGLFTGSIGDGLVLGQTPSAVSEGGLTELYNECKLLYKAMICPVQFPSAVCATKQKKNGGRLHHQISSRYLWPKLLKTPGVGNIAWDTYPEDIPFTCEPRRTARKQRGQSDGEPRKHRKAPVPKREKRESKRSTKNP